LKPTENKDEENKIYRTLDIKILKEVEGGRMI